jgi:hypothetical protein
MKGQQIFGEKVLIKKFQQKRIERYNLLLKNEPRILELSVHK